jgi:hypothetical protein
MTDHLPWTRDDLSYLLLTLALTVFALAPLAYPGYMQVHSGFVPAYNLADLAGRPLQLGWKPNIASSFDPLRGDGLWPYYLALPVVWLGGSPLSGVKAVFALSFLLGAAGFYLWLRPWVGPAGASLAALVYTYLPYRLAAVYVRGAWGEAFFLGLLPWALAATEGRATSRIYTRTAWIVLVWALLGMSQAGLAVWGFVLLAAWGLLINRRGYGQLLAALGGTLAGLALTLLIAGFSTPPSPINLFDHFLYPAQLFSAYWGFGASRPGWEDGLSLGLGFAALGLGMLTLFMALGQARTHPGQFNQATSARRLLLPCIPGVIFALLTLAPTAFLWRLTGLHRTLTYPWQLLGLSGLCLAALAGAALKLDRRLAALPTYAGLVILTLLASYSYLEPRFTQLAPGNGPLAAWDAHRVMLIDCQLSVTIPPAAAGLREPTPGWLPVADYGRPRPGDNLRLTLTWQATRPFDRDLKLFLHLLDAAGQLVAQVDPLAGAGAGSQGMDYLTSQWAPGELILDEVAVAIPPDTPPGPYRLAFGLYDAGTLQRLPVVGRADGQVEIEIELGARDREPLSLSPSRHRAEGRP